jgi:Zn ribbon nucleic-acid-binding protein
MLAFPKKHRAKKNSLDSKLWLLISQIVRIRDCIECGTGALFGLVPCITCGYTRTWQEMDAGHFISRNKKATKFNLLNIHAQCKKCNRFESGRQFEHGQAIDRIHGAGTAAQLLILSKMKCKLTDEWYLNEIEKAKKQLKELKTHL